MTLTSTAVSATPRLLGPTSPEMSSGRARTLPRHRGGERQVPAQATSLWPAIWMLGSNCQVTNIYTADTGYSTCPTLGGSGYIETDMVECYISGGWCQFHVANPSFGLGSGCDATYPVGYQLAHV